MYIGRVSLFEIVWPNDFKQGCKSLWQNEKYQYEPVEYEELPNNSRVWVYQADRELTESEVSYISKKAKIFI